MVLRSGGIGSGGGGGIGVELYASNELDHSLVFAWTHGRPIQDEIPLLRGLQQFLVQILLPMHFLVGAQRGGVVGVVRVVGVVGVVENKNRERISGQKIQSFRLC